MSRGTLNWLLLTALVGSVALNGVLRPRPAQLNLEFMPEMVRTPRYNAYSPNPNFADGKTLQSPVEGTIARGQPPLHLTSSPQDALRAAETLTPPRSAAGGQMGIANTGPARFEESEAKAEERGAAVFASFCQPCHGTSGRGDGLVVARGYPAPPSLFADNARNMKDGQMFHVVTFGQKNMPGYAAQVTREDRWNAIAYVRSLQAKAAAEASNTGGGAAAAAAQTSGAPAEAGGQR